MRTHDDGTLFFQPTDHGLWDTWIYHYAGNFFMFYLTSGSNTYGGVGLATSDDGVHWNYQSEVLTKDPEAVWLGSGAIWTTADPESETNRFLMNFSEFRKTQEGDRQTIFFAESRDLVSWERLGSELEFVQDQHWYEACGRWDNLWAVPRSNGGYFGYWAATPKNGKVGMGFGESLDGLHWRALEPPLLTDVPLGPSVLPSPEVGAVILHGGTYYALCGLDDLQPLVNDDFTDFRPGHTTFVSPSPHGPFIAAGKNRRLLVGNASYFLRFAETPDGILANHHSWETMPGEPLNLKPGTASLAPLKRAVWDEEGVLRLKWWERNERAKGRRVDLEPRLGDTKLDLEQTLILEGTLSLTSFPARIYLHGTGPDGSAFLVDLNGVVRYGSVLEDGACFTEIGRVDRETSFGEKATFRLIRKGRITEFYLDDYLMQCYCLPEIGSGRISLLGSPHQFSNLTAWYCDGAPSAPGDDSVGSLAIEDRV